MVAQVRVESAVTHHLGVWLYCTEQRRSKQVRLCNNVASYAKDSSVVLQQIVILSGAI